MRDSEGIFVDAKIVSGVQGLDIINHTKIQQNMRPMFEAAENVHGDFIFGSKKQLSPGEEFGSGTWHRPCPRWA